MDLGLAAGTVARAYREPEATSLIHTRRGAGTRVAPLPPDAPSRDRAEVAGDFVSWAFALGWGEEDVLETMGHSLRERDSEGFRTRRHRHVPKR
ncbi:hypothetical protein ACH4S8_34310 [Streptomyces sp. NPDC021080]|uniref:hypothetical protein n=1 Tax=Streptomyces sp. NPDC021080 TaxID=3365110 RepID=UPI00379C4092